jgi:hypothetical protein
LIGVMSYLCCHPHQSVVLLLSYDLQNLSVRVVEISAMKWYEEPVTTMAKPSDDCKSGHNSI